jgi:hypothetical protein
MQDLVFERRTLPGHLVTVPPTELVTGHVYYRVSFLDEDMVVPEMSTVVFLGRDLDARLHGLYFQDTESYAAGERATDEMWASILEEDLLDADGYSWVGDDMQFDWEPGRERSSVCEFERALDQLLACSLRRQRWDGTTRLLEPRDETE